MATPLLNALISFELLTGHKADSEEQVFSLLLRNWRNVSEFPQLPHWHRDFHSLPLTRRANIKIEDLFPYAESKAKFVNDKNLKRANFSEAIDQIEAALAGEDPSPISTQQEAVVEQGADAAEVAAEEPAPPKAEATKTAKSQPTSQKTEPAKPPPKQKKVNNAVIANAKAAKPSGGQVKTKNTAKAAQETAQPPPTPPPEEEILETPPPEVSVPTTDPVQSEDIMSQVEPKPVADVPSADTESPTSRSGRKIKPKK